MINTSRCNGGACTVVMPKAECRMVNGGSGGGYVNRCEQALDDKNEMVLATSKITGNGDQIVATVTNNGTYSSSNTSEVVSLQVHNMALDEIKKMNEKIKQMSEEIYYWKRKVEEFEKHSTNNVSAARDDPLDVLPFTPVSSTCSSGMGDMSTVELQEVKPRRRRNRQVANKLPNSNPLEPSQIKRQRTRSTRAKSNESGSGKMQEFSLITADNAYYTCLGNYDPVKDEPISENSNSNLEIPSWRIKPYSSWYSMEGTENMSDDIFENRHSRLELSERKRKRWDMQRLRELRRIEYLKEGRNKHHSQKSNEKDKQELITLLPNPVNIKAIEITDNLPVSAFGSNLHVKKNLKLFKFTHSQWCNDGSKIPLEQNNVRGLRSSGRIQIFDSM
ncbi:male-specific lethal 1 homolog [Sipha flava]|uniref:Male-specific lethal 1 homolog n=1 Tax=Sipha flava TaxID=143950 RepID=A0A2S2R319_9HEMI|nr:male-specific lethal 1 homolog [Sipha flava]